MGRQAGSKVRPLTSDLPLKWDTHSPWSTRDINTLLETHSKKLLLLNLYPGSQLLLPTRFSG